MHAITYSFESQLKGAATVKSQWQKLFLCKLIYIQSFSFLDDCGIFSIVVIMFITMLLCLRCYLNYNFLSIYLNSFENLPVCLLFTAAVIVSADVNVIVVRYERIGKFKANLAIYF